MQRSDDNPFKISAAPEPAQALGLPVSDSDLSTAPAERIQSWVDSSAIFLLIKGTPQRPLCGFSANTVAIFESLGLPYRTFDVLSDESIRRAAKTVAGWPTFPQIFINGEFVGGNDSLTEIYETGELQGFVSGAGP